jgi:uncharacterized protein (DUF488 family)
MDLFTIGHSNHTLESFIRLLRQQNVTAVGDVRSHPYSRFLPHFNRVVFKEALENQGIRYVFLGQELGARPNNPECYVNGKALYKRIADTEAFQEGIQRIIQGIKKYKIALMCAESDPITCHRAILVCHHLRNYNLQIGHILKNGDLESHDHLEDRLLLQHGIVPFSTIQSEPIQLSLFSEPVSVASPPSSREECLEKAYSLQGDEIAYVEKKEHDDERANNQSIHHRIYEKKR